MIAGSIFTLCILSALFVLIYFFIPFWMMGFRIHKGNVTDNLVKAFLVSNFITISLVYFLALIGIYNVVTFLLMIAFIYIGYIYYIRREGFVRSSNTLLSRFIGTHEGVYSFKIYYTRWKNQIFGHLWTDTKRFFKNPVNLVIFTSGMVFAAVYRCYHSVVQAQYGTSDIYVHTNWIRYLDNNQIFLDGIYPYGYHNIMSVLAKLTGFNAAVVTRFMGGIIGVLICAMLYYSCRRIFKSAFVANAALIFYAATSFAGGTWRQQFALPQEFGMLFLYPCGIFLHRYLVKRKLSDLVYFGIAVSLTISAHFYVTILAVLLCAGIVIANFWKIFNKKVIISLSLAIVISLASAAGPMFLGLANGKKWHGSMEWALTVMSKDKQADVASEASAGQLPPDPNNPDAVPVTPSNEPEEIPQTFEEMKIKAKEYVSQITSLEWFIYFLYALAFILIYSLIKALVFRKNDQPRLAIGFTLYGIFLLIIIFIPMRGFPMIMDFARSQIFYGYLAPIILAGPFQLLYDVLHRKNIYTRMVHLVVLAVISALMLNYVQSGEHWIGKPSAFREQLTSAVNVYYDIVENFPKNKWTIVSPVDETSMVRGYGFHYELKDFILEMDNFKPDTKIYVPTKYVFVYIEKRPLEFNEVIHYSNGMPKTTDHITLDEAHIALDAFGETAMYDPLFFYSDPIGRRVLSAKAYYWAQEYIKYFPKEMKVYYEDSEFIVYKITQNEYALNNFAIPYEGNIAEKKNHTPIKPAEK